DFEVRGGEHGQFERRLQVGLVEAGVHPLRVGGLELAVEVDVAVDRVDEPVQPFTGAHVGGVGDDPQFVVGTQVGKGDPLSVEHLGRVEGDAVEGDFAYGRSHQVDEACRPGFRAVKPDHRGGGEGLVA